jgi:hypothetical protein
VALRPVIHPVNGARGTTGHGWQHAWRGSVYCRRWFRDVLDGDVLCMAEPAADVQAAYLEMVRDWSETKVWDGFPVLRDMQGGQ